MISYDVLTAAERTEAAHERAIDALHGTIRLLCEANDCDPRLIAEAEGAIRDVIRSICFSAWCLDQMKHGRYPVAC